MKGITTLLIASSLFLTCGASMAQEATYQQINDVYVPLTGISDNGKWLCGSFQGAAVIYDTETQKATNLPQDDYMAKIIQAVSNDGTFVGTLGSDYGTAGPAYYKDGKWTMLEVPQGYQMGGGMAISADSKTIIGCIGAEMGSEVPMVATIWRLEGDTYKLEILPSPEKDIFSMIPQAVAALEMSSDASVIIGRFTDWAGFYEQPIVWKLGTDNKYTYQVLGDNVLFNLDKPNPGPSVLYDDYVTAEQGTPEYNEQYNKWKEEVQKRDDKLNEFLTGYLFGRVFRINGDGTQALGVIKSVEEEEQKICSISLKDESIKQYPYSAHAGAVTNSGIILYSADDLAYVMNKGEEDGIALNEWLKEHYNLNIDEGQTVEGEIITGNINLNKSETAFVACYSDAKSFAYNNYVVKLPAPLSSTTSIQAIDNDHDIHIFTNGNSIVIEGALTEAKVLDVSGKIISTDKTSLVSMAPGIYIVKATANHGKATVRKVVIQ